MRAAVVIATAVATGRSTDSADVPAGAHGVTAGSAAGVAVATVTTGATTTTMSIATGGVATRATTAAIGVTPVAGDIANVVCADVGHGAIEPADGDRFAAIE
jgi:hypothetical protein